MKRLLLVVGLISTWIVAPAQSADDPGLGANLAAQAAADLVRETAGTDGAFLAAGLLKDKSDASDASTLFQYPGDEIVVVTLTGAQIKHAFERSVSLYPQSNSAFLQISGFSATFSKSAPANKRIVDVSSDFGKLADSQNYTIAMPSSLARGGLGYFKIWDKPNITRSLNITLERVLKGKRLNVGAQTPRWTAAD